MFEVGEKVVCVDASAPATELIKNEIYTIREFSEGGPDEELGFSLEEMDPEDFYFHWRFRKIDHGFAEKLLKEISEEVLQLETGERTYYVPDIHY